MAAGQYNIIIEKGSTFTRNMAVKDVDGLPVDLTDASIQAKYRKRHQDSTSVSFDVSIPSPATDGSFVVSMTDAVTAGISTGQGVWDITIQYSDGTSERIIEGTVTVKEWAGRPD